MDMRSKDILKNAIMKYDGTVVVVSHDREFLDGMVAVSYTHLGRKFAGEGNSSFCQV